MCVRVCVLCVCVCVCVRVCTDVNVSVDEKGEEDSTLLSLSTVQCAMLVGAGVQRPVLLSFFYPSVLVCVCVCVLV